MASSTSNYFEFGPYKVECVEGKPKNHDNCLEIERKYSWNENVNLLYVD